MSAAAISNDHTHDHGHDHHELSFLKKYIWSTDHKVIGIQYAVSGLLFLLFGFFLMMMMRWRQDRHHERWVEGWGGTGGGDGRVEIFCC
jgi:hypothetical protein